jgi:hypothetical protein
MTHRSIGDFQYSPQNRQERARIARNGPPGHDVLVSLR